MAESRNRGNKLLIFVQEHRHDYRDPYINVIALHGFNSTFEKTWKQNDRFLSPWLYEIWSSTRVSAYNHPMSFSSEDSLLDRSALEARAEDLLADIYNKLGPMPPLVFLCDNIAGILVKEVFFSVPDMFTSPQDTLLRLALTATDASDNEDSQRAEVTGAIKKGPSALQTAAMRFEMIKHQYHIISVRKVAAAVDQDRVSIQNSSVRDSNVSVSMPEVDGKITLSQLPHGVLPTILSNAIKKHPKDYQYNVMKYRRELAAKYEYDGELGKLHQGATSHVVSPLCEKLLNLASTLVTIYGSAGSGKSVLASQISTTIDDFVLSFSFSVADYRRSSYRDLLLSFFLQILYRDISVFESTYVQSLFSQIVLTPTVSSADLYRLLCALLSNLSETKVVYVIDAIDECDAESLDQLVGDFKRMAFNGPLKCTVFLTCRPSDAVMTILGPFEEHNSINLDDNMKYVRSELLAREFSGKKFENVRNHLNKENATPLKVSLIATLGRMEELSDIPDNYGSIYKRILARIDAPLKWLETVLLCIVFARRPLTVAELAAAIGVDHCISEVGGTELTLQKICFAAPAPKKLQDDLELALGSLVHIQNNVVLVHGTLRDVIRHDLGLFAQNKSSMDINQIDARPWRALWRSLAILLSPEIRDGMATGTENRLFDHFYNVPISPQPYSFARYAGYSLAHDLAVINADGQSGEMINATLDALSQFWDTTEARSWWVQNFVALQQGAGEAADSPLKTSFYLAVALGMQSTVRKLLPEVSGSFATIKLALQAAVCRGNVKITRLLLTTASNFEEDIWHSAIELSCIHGCVELFRSVLMWRSESNGQQLSEVELYDCLSLGAKHGYWHIIRALKGDHPSLMDAIEPEKLISLIEKAAEQGRDGVIYELLSIYNNVFGSSSFLEKAENHVNQLKIEVDTVDASGQIKDVATRIDPDGANTDTTMQEVEDEVLSDDIPEVDQTFKKDLDLSLAMIKAAKFGNPVAVHLLASTSGSILKYEAWGEQMMALHEAAAYGNIEALIGLLDCGADIESVDNEDRTALLYACFHPYYNRVNPIKVVKAVKALLERGANPDHAAASISKCRALHIVAFKGEAAFVKILLEFGASENARTETDNWETPLHLAVRDPIVREPNINKKYAETVETLLKFGANVNIPRRDGKTALHIAIDRAEWNEDVVWILRKFGADIDILDESGRSPLYYAVSKQDDELVKMLLPERRMSQRPLLFDAAAGEIVDRVRQLLDAGCDKTERDKWGRTAYDVAKDPEVRSLLASGNVTEDDDKAALVEAVGREEWCPMTTRRNRMALGWSCEICDRDIDDELFYHCCLCSGSCDVLDTFDICARCFAASNCKKVEHRILTRFVAESMTSYEEFSPNIATFGLQS
ncbi:hypothetical protein F4825DRAFT_455013 [Nemania diffusa]|nr:hypothetical protein F4825DRAFT_455013 [Nemania diffusa]